MPHLTPNEKRTRANAFVKKWQNETREEAEAKSFWDDFFQIFGLERYQIARYEYNIARQNRASGFIDVFWAGHLLCEHKSAKKDLNKAEEQAMGYIDELRRRSPEDVPPRVIICDFARFRLLNLDTDERLEFNCPTSSSKNVPLILWTASSITSKPKKKPPISKQPKQWANCTKLSLPITAIPTN